MMRYPATNSTASLPSSWVQMDMLVDRKTRVPDIGKRDFVRGWGCVRQLAEFSEAKWCCVAV
jgi:hypothetical protein